MTQSYIFNEIFLRLRKAGPRPVENLAHLVGIDFAAAIERVPSIINALPAITSATPGEQLRIHGAVPFEMKLSIMGEDVTHTLRAAYSAELVDDVDAVDDVDRQTGEPLRTLGRIEIDWQILDWRDLDRLNEETGEHLRAAAPTWSESFEALLPARVERLILDQIEDQARALERARRTNA